MPLFKMARDPKTDADAPADEEKARPGTSGTEALLVTNRRQASQQFQSAQRAEKAYRAKKRASAARQNFQDAKGHFKESFRHFGSALKMSFRAVKSIPYVFGAKSEERRRARALANKKKLEERLAKQNNEAEDGAEPAAESTA